MITNNFMIESRMETVFECEQSVMGLVADLNECAIASSVTSYNPEEKKKILAVVDALRTAQFKLDDLACYVQSKQPKTHEPDLDILNAIKENKYDDLLFEIQKYSEEVQQELFSSNICLIDRENIESDDFITTYLHLAVEEACLDKRRIPILERILEYTPIEYRSLTNTDGDTPRKLINKVTFKHINEVERILDLFKCY